MKICCILFITLIFSGCAYEKVNIYAGVEAATFDARVEIDLEDTVQLNNEAIAEFDRWINENEKLGDLPK